VGAVRTWCKARHRTALFLCAEPPLPKTAIEVLQAQVEELLVIKNVVARFEQRISDLESFSHVHTVSVQTTGTSSLLVPPRPVILPEPEPVEDLGG
jgi:hypothetical protein